MRNQTKKVKEILLQAGLNRKQFKLASKYESFWREERTAILLHCGLSKEQEIIEPIISHLLTNGIGVTRYYFTPEDKENNNVRCYHLSCINNHRAFLENNLYWYREQDRENYPCGKWERLLRGEIFTA